MAKVVVIGGGVIGCAIALRLARDSHVVTLLERDRVGAHASGAAAGLLAPYSEGWASEQLSELAAESLALFPELVERIRVDVGVDPEYRESDSLRLALTAEEERGLRELCERLRRRGIEVELLERDDAREAEPELSDEVRLAARVRESQVTPIRLVEGMARAAVAAGAVVKQSTAAVRLHARGRGVQGVTASDGHADADWVIVAAGPWSPEIAATADVRLDVQPRRGQLVALAPNRGLVRSMLTHGNYYLVPKPDGSLVAGSTEEEQGFDARATVAGVSELLERTRRLVPRVADAGIARVWAGIRPYTPSGLPLIGPAAEYENLVVATGHHRDGILLAPVTAELVAAGLSGSWRNPAA